jgi:hypothetical protein
MAKQNFRDKGPISELFVAQPRHGPQRFPPAAEAQLPTPDEPATKHPLLAAACHPSPSRSCSAPRPHPLCPRRGHLRKGAVGVCN